MPTMRRGQISSTPRAKTVAGGTRKSVTATTTTPAPARSAVRSFGRLPSSGVTIDLLPVLLQRTVGVPCEGPVKDRAIRDEHAMPAVDRTPKAAPRRGGGLRLFSLCLSESRVRALGVARRTRPLRSRPWRSAPPGWRERRDGPGFCRQGVGWRPIPARRAPGKSELAFPLPAAYAIPAVAAICATTATPETIHRFVIVHLLLHRPP